MDAFWEIKSFDMTCSVRKCLLLRYWCLHEHSLVKLGNLATSGWRDDRKSIFFSFWPNKLDETKQHFFFNGFVVKKMSVRVKFSDRSAEEDLTRLQKFNLTEEEDSEGICRFDRSYSGSSNINITIIIIMKIVGKFVNFWHFLIHGRPYYSRSLCEIVKNLRNSLGFPLKKSGC